MTPRASKLIAAAVVIAAASIGSCKQESAPPTAVTPASKSPPRALAASADPLSDPALGGVWQPYDDASNLRLGALTVERAALRFAKGLVVRIAPADGFFKVESVTPLSGSKPIGQVCGDDPPKSASLTQSDHPHPRSLKLSFYDVPTGPGADPNFDLHRCITFTYVRE